MKSSHKLDMTSGPILKLVLLFAIPIYIGNLLQRLYTTVDTLIIGNFCSSASLAAVGTGTQPVDILLCVFLGLGTGVSILVSQCTGKRRYPERTWRQPFHLNIPISWPPAPSALS